MKIKTTAKLLALSCVIMSANAHRVWVDTKHTHGGEILKTNLGYGHFPHLEEISKSRLDIFKPLQLVDENGTQDLIQKGKNYQFETKSAVSDGSYLVLAQYKPNYWSKNKTGWKRANLKEHANSTYCEQTQMFGKNVVNVGHKGTDTKIVTKPVGQNLEIVPLDNPANVKVNSPFKVQVLYKGQPLKGATLTATFKGFGQKTTGHSDHGEVYEPQAFSDVTDNDGMVEIIPLKRGFWKAAVEHKTPYHDQNVCQFEANYSTLTFQIGSHHH